MSPWKPTWLMFLLAWFVLAACPGLAGAADIEMNLAYSLDEMADDELVSVILYMSDQAPIAEMNESLRQNRSSLAERHLAIITALKEATISQTDLLEILTDKRDHSDEVVGFTSHWLANMIIVQATKATILEFAERSDIEYIEPNFSFSLIEPIRNMDAVFPERGIGVTPGLRAINADRVWYELGINGTGVLVANCDTGVDGTHPALSSRWRGANGHPASECWLSLINNGHDDFPYDGNDHGTHVMGTITGLAPDDTIGVAWGAQWIATDPINQNVSSGFDNDIIDAYEWFADPDGNAMTTDDVPDVVQNSWRINEGFSGDYTDCDSRWWNVIDNCEAAGVVTVWSAGNEGSGGSETIGSPADRATTFTNAFSVGAVDATNHSYPYPIAYFSSLGPTGCSVPAERKIKPEISAPGVDIYSCVPNGGYDGTYDGTSMSGPHVAGVVALMREAAPDLDVDTIKEVIMETAVDHGVAGEDNTFGWGVIDAYEAVLAVMGSSTLSGTVTNASSGGDPIPDATVMIVEAGRQGTTDATGFYTINVEAGTYTVTADHPSFAPETEYSVTTYEGSVTTRDFSLNDDGAPWITNTTQLDSTEDTMGPYLVECTVTDFSSPVDVDLFYRTNGGPYSSVPMAGHPDNTYDAAIPGQPVNSLVEYYIRASDAVMNSGTDPMMAPENAYFFYVATHSCILSDDMESGSPDFTHQAGSGFSDQWHLSTARNYTSGGTTSWKCGDVTSGDYGDLLDAQLLSPQFEILLDPYLEFWHWMNSEVSGSYPGKAYDGGLVEISTDGGPWQQIFPEGGYTHTIRPGGTPGPFAEDTEVFAGDINWERVVFDLSPYYGLAQIRFRFGSDGASGGEGWYIDDVYACGFELTMHDITDESHLESTIRFTGVDPNPFTKNTTLRFQLPQSEDVTLQIFDMNGRLVRTLLSGAQDAGSYNLTWDGRDDHSTPVSGGVYLTRLSTKTESRSHKIILTP